MSKKENHRVQVLVCAGESGRTNREIALALGVCVRQVQRMKKALKEEGPAGLAHGNRGCTPKHALTPEIAASVVELYKTEYDDFNFTHFTEKLVEVEGIQINRSSVRRVLLAAGYRSPKKRRAPKHRSRRERRACEGAMLQIDGSPHDWLEGRGPWMCLVGGIDDATGKVAGAVFREHEDAHGYFLLMRQVVAKHGIPETVYRDRHGIFERKPNEPTDIWEDFEGKRSPTQFGRLMEELGIRAIPANSPQAKGRIERLWATFQDRLVSELRLAGACTMEEAEAVLARVIIDHNRRFARKPNDPRSVYRRMETGKTYDPIFCFKYPRTVGRDNTVIFGRRFVQIPRGPGGRSYSGCRVEVQHRFDDSLHIYYQGMCIASTPPAETPPKVIRVLDSHGRQTEECPWANLRSPKPKEEKPVQQTERRPYKPPPNHPWRRDWVTKSLNR
ncbi:MAG TPA: ISNCY family transposase [Armatimonadota bacterium]|nr:ISNCY family transposase [Armatimonadota bacterium]